MIDLSFHSTPIRVYIATRCKRPAPLIVGGQLRCPPIAWLPTTLSASSCVASKRLSGRWSVQWRWCFRQTVSVKFTTATTATNTSTTTTTTVCICTAAQMRWPRTGIQSKQDKLYHLCSLYSVNRLGAVMGNAQLTLCIYVFAFLDYSIQWERILSYGLFKSGMCFAVAAGQRRITRRTYQRRRRSRSDMQSRAKSRSVGFQT